MNTLKEFRTQDSGLKTHDLSSGSLSLWALLADISNVHYISFYGQCPEVPACWETRLQDFSPPYDLWFHHKNQRCKQHLG